MSEDDMTKAPKPRRPWNRTPATSTHKNRQDKLHAPKHKKTERPIDDPEVIVGIAVGIGYLAVAGLALTAYTL
jgi:hypothetical protein